LRHLPGLVDAVDAAANPDLAVGIEEHDADSAAIGSCWSWAAHAPKGQRGNRSREGGGGPKPPADPISSRRRRAVVVESELNFERLALWPPARCSRSSICAGSTLLRLVSTDTKMPPSLTRWP
jgi:hypothetical protein